MLAKLKEFFLKNKKSCILAIIVAGCAVAYCFGYDFSPDAILEKFCSLTGLC